MAEEDEMKEDNYLAVSILVEMMKQDDEEEGTSRKMQDENYEEL